jgi:predicted ATPase
MRKVLLPVGSGSGRNALDLVHLVLAAAHERPVLLVLDDLQWAARASLCLLRQLARHVGDSAIVILCTLRAEELTADHPLAKLMTILPREAPCRHISLTDLSLAESTELAELLLEQHSPDRTTATVAGALAEALLNHTGGNPFFYPGARPRSG